MITAPEGLREAVAILRAHVGPLFTHDAGMP